MTQKSIFREAAIERLSSPEKLDQLMQVTRPRGWLALVGIGLFLVAALLWGFLATVSTTVNGQGMIIRTGVVNNVISTAAGQIKHMNVKPGQIIERGQTIAILFRWDTDSQAITQIYQVISPHSGRVLEVKAETGQFIERGAPLISIEPLDSTLEAVLYVSPMDGKKVQPGMEGQVAPSTIRPEEYGYILGKVKSVSAFPTTKEGTQRLLGSKELSDKFFQTGPPHEIRVALFEDPATSSGYKWSSRGPDIAVESGTFCSGKIVVRRQSPVSLMIPILKDKLGLYRGPAFEEK